MIHLPLVLFALAGQVGDPPPVVDEAPAEEAEEAPPVERPAGEADDDGGADDGDPGDDDGDDEDEGDDDGDDDGDDALPASEGPFGSVAWGGVSGCAIGGAAPLAGSALGLGLFYGGSACGDAAGVVGGVSGALIGIPSLLLLGPCAGGGAACGASIGAVMSSQDPVNAMFWSLPGIGLGLASGAVASVGVLVSTSTNSAALGDAAQPLGTTLVVIGGLGALAAGPLAVAGATFTQKPWEDVLGTLDGTHEPPLRDGGIEAKAAAKNSPTKAASTKKHPSKKPRAMVF